jgi:hypothetical protein
MVRPACRSPRTSTRSSTTPPQAARTLGPSPTRPMVFTMSSWDHVSYTPPPQDMGSGSSALNVQRYSDRLGNWAGPRLQASFSPAYGPAYGPAGLVLLNIALRPQFCSRASANCINQADNQSIKRVREWQWGKEKAWSTVTVFFYYPALCPYHVPAFQILQVCQCQPVRLASTRQLYIRSSSRSSCAAAVLCYAVLLLLLLLLGSLIHGGMAQLDTSPIPCAAGIYAERHVVGAKPRLCPSFLHLPPASASPTPML